MKRTLAVLALCLAATVGIAQSNYMNYQGKLVTANGSPLPPGQAKVEVNLYDSAIDGIQIWGPFFFDSKTTEGHAENVSVMNDGRFNVILGPKDTAGRALSSAFQHVPTENRFIELRVNEGAPILPRHQFLSTPYAFQAGRLPDVSNTAEGNVGVGTDSPAEKLDVSGNVKVSGTLNVSGQATMASAQVIDILEIGTSQLSTTASVLTLNNDMKLNQNLEVTGDIKFGGRIVNFNIDETRSHDYVEPGGDGKTLTFPLNLSSEKYFCILDGLNWNSSTSSGRAENGAWLSIDQGMWNLTVRADGNGMTKANVRCLQYN